MVQCSCGWTGINLRPNYRRNTADCPRCHRPFEGILARDAIVTSQANDEQVGNRFETTKLFFSTASATIH